MGKNKLIIIDSNSILHRAFHALPPLTTKKGELVNAIYGFLLVFFKIIKEFQPDYIAACFDYPGPTFRHEKLKEYKAKRIPAPKEFYDQIPKLKKILNLFSVPIFERAGFEADDIIGTISHLVSEEKISPAIETIILSSDLDMLQCINPNTKVYSLKKGVKETVLYDSEMVKEKFGLLPKQVPDFKALRGDPSDNIPGVPGIGEKTATRLLKTFGAVENIYSALESDISGKARYQELEKQSKEIGEIKSELKEILVKKKKQVFLSKTLVQVQKNVPIDFDLEECRWREFDEGLISQELEKFQFHSLVKRLPEILTKNGNRENLKLW